MSYQVLARKYRPQKFTEIAGQEHVLNSLVHALDHDRLHHAYLFSGTRGVGKTSLARLLAKSMNCLRGISSIPCGTCQHCIAIKTGNFVDFIEIDAASRTKVEDTREILENVQYMPSQGQFKIYLIDEVHMLSRHSLDALLKTLEEPPQHVKFILATTDSQKLPATILSRCLQFHLKHLTVAQICNQLAYVLKTEMIDYQQQSLKLIAQAARGSMRDALSLVDQAIAFGNGQIMDQDIKTMLGIIDIEMIDQLISYIIKSDSENIIIFSNKIIELGKDPITVLDSLAEAFYAASIYQFTKQTYGTVCSKARVVEMSQQLSADLLQLYYQLTIKAKEDVPLAPNSECGLGMSLLRLCAFTSVDLNKHQNSKMCIAKHVCTQEIGANKMVPSKKFDDATTYNDLIIEKQKLTTSEKHEDNWYQLSQSLELKGTAMQVILNSNLLSTKNNLYRLKPDYKIQVLITNNIQQKIEAALSQYLGQKIQIQFVEDTSVKPIKLKQQKYDDAAMKITPYQILQNKKAQNINNILDLLKNNPNVQKLKHLGFKINEDSIRLKNKIT